MTIKIRGIYTISSDEYHGANVTPAPALSRGVIRDLIYSTPAHARFNHPALNPQHVEEAEPKFDIGTAAHSLLLDGIDNCTVVYANDWRSKVAKEARDEARAAGKTPLLDHHYERVVAMVEAAQRQIKGCAELSIGDLAADGHAERSLIWQEGPTWCKARPDWQSNDNRLILDYKTTDGSADPSDFAKKIIGMGYDIQDAWYKRASLVLTGIEPQFVFAVQECSPPYLMSFVALPPEFTAMGEDKVKEGIILWERCIQTGQWPAYPAQVCWVDAPPWALMQWEERRAAAIMAEKPAKQPDIDLDLAGAI